MSVFAVQIFTIYYILTFTRLFAIFQARLSELTPYEDVLQKCINISSQISHVPSIATETADVRTRWEKANLAAKSHQQLVEKSMGSWREFNQLQQDVKGALNAKLDRSHPNLTSVNLEYLQSEKDHYKVILWCFYMS